MCAQSASHDEGPWIADQTSSGRFDVPAIPEPTTPLIGRERSIARLADLLGDPGVRLVTLTGAGGIGKTRLALAVASRLASAVAFVPLATITEPGLIVPTIAQALGIEPLRSLPIDRVVTQTVRGQGLLLVLDNLEQVLAGRQVIADLLAATPDLRILATSRERLAISGEHVMPVEPLTLPADDSAAGILDSSAARLFAARARAAQPAFAITDDNADDVAAICRHLDGLPLAIELAAARSNLLSPNVLARRLERRLHLLTGGPLDAPARHRTMWDAIAWSYELLSEPERRFWARLGVFSGDFAAEAGEAIGDAGDHDVLTLLQSLIDKGLLQSAVDATGEPRFRLLETTREFALEQLAVNGDEATTRAAHAAWFVARAIELEPLLMGNDGMTWFYRAEADIANFRAALTWLTRRNEFAAALDLVNALAWFWTAPPYLAEGFGWFSDLLARAGPGIDPARHAKALQAAGDLAHWRRDDEIAAPMFSQAVDLWREAGNEGRVASSLRSLSSIAIDRQDFARAAELLREAYELSREAGEAWDAAGAANLLGHALAATGNLTEATHWHETALAGWQRLGDHSHQPAALNGLGNAAFAAGDDQRARDAYDAAIHIHGDDEAGYDTAWSLAGFAAIAARHQQGSLAARLLAVATREITNIGVPIRPHHQQHVDTLISTLRTRLGNAAFALEWDRGQRLTFTEAVAEARRLQLPEIAPTDGLTRRELEVLALLAEGASDIEIGERLFISRRTVSKHVATILEKMGASNRTVAATTAIRRGLVPDRRD